MKKVKSDLNTVLSKPDNANYVSRVRRPPVAMTKYEHAKVIGVRAEQIARGAQPFVIDDGGRFDPIAIAVRELNAGVLPFVVVRRLPDGTQENRRLRDYSTPFLA